MLEAQLLGKNEKILDTSIQDQVSTNLLIKIDSAHGGELLRKFYESQVAMQRGRVWECRA